MRLLNLYNDNKLSNFQNRGFQADYVKSIKVNNSLFRSRDREKYKLNCIETKSHASLSRLCKKLYYQAFFEANLNNMKKKVGGH